MKSVWEVSEKVKDSLIQLNAELSSKPIPKILENLSKVQRIFPTRIALHPTSFGSLNR